MNFRILLVSSLLMCNCIKHITYIPDPDKDIDMWVQNFRQQRSFNYRYELQTRSVSSEAKGACVIGRGECVRGSWRHEDTEFMFEYVGIMDVEYSKEDGKWHESSRGEESDIFAQIERILEFDAFEFITSETRYRYRFKANIPFLAPGRRKEMVGLIEISNRKFLPEMIWAGLPDSSIFWKIELSDYNKKKRIKAPVRVWRDHVLIDARDYVKTVKRRFELLAIDYRIKTLGDDIILSVPNYYTREDVKIVLATAVLNVYDVAEDKESAAKVGYMKDDVNMPILLGDVLINQNDVRNVRIKFDVVSKPYLEIALYRKQLFPSEVAFEVDGTIHGTAMLDTTKKIDRIVLYTDMQYYNMQLLMVSLLQPLPKLVLKPAVEEQD